LPNGETTLCDTGPLVALYDPSDLQEENCRTTLAGLAGPLVTTLPVLTEAMYLLEHPVRRELLWELLLSGGVGLAEMFQEDLSRMHNLMAKYADLPMDFADASLVVLGERLRLRKVFTLDRHFSLYRPSYIRRFEIVP